MLFSSVEFLFIFLPLALALTLAARRVAGASVAIGVLTVASVVFYSVLKPWNLPVLLGSVGFNFVLARAIDGARASGDAGRRRLWLVVGIAGNLGLLFWFKYAGFVAGQLGVPTAGEGWLARVLPAALPLGISFYTFQQIAYLVDLSKGLCERATLVRHQLLVSFFPHHIAGPITHPRTFLPQLSDVRPSWELASLGLFIFAMGLAKKVVLADPLGRFVDPSFADPAALSMPGAWAAVLAYMLQLYLDFSGYSDMAVGLGLLFGIRLPWNFESPYTSTSIAEFWRRWHITLSDFLKQYVYVPLGGSRRGRGRTLLNLLITMLLGGIWHGAGWTFVLWGLLHGIALAINHAWRWTGVTLPGLVAKPIGWAITMAVVMAGWVLFRAETIGEAGIVFQRLAGVEAPPQNWEANAIHRAWPFIVLAGAVVLWMPNTRQWSERFRPTWRWIVLGCGLMVVGVLHVMANLAPPEFLYFDF